MPRIAVAVAVVAITGASIGINIARHPVVWEMVGAPGQASPSVHAPALPGPITVEPTVDLSQMGPPETPGPYRSDMAPIAPEEDRPGASVGTSPEAQLISTRREADSAMGAAGLADLPPAVTSPANPGGQDAASEPWHPVDGLPSPAAPSAPRDPAAETRWSAQEAPSIQYAAKPASPSAELSAWRSETPQKPRKAMVPIDWGSESSLSQSDWRTWTTSDGRRIERLPAVDDQNSPADPEKRRSADEPISLSATRH